LWIGTSAGLNKLSLGSQVFSSFLSDIHNPKSISSDQITALYKSREDILWIGTPTGINILNFNKQSFSQHFSTFYNNPVYGISGTGSDLVWLFTSQGFALFNTKTETVEYHKKVFNMAVTHIYTNFCETADGIYGSRPTFGTC
jgi:ligand-binding sensor domain-containing protein